MSTQGPSGRGRMRHSAMSAHHSHVSRPTAELNGKNLLEALAGRHPTISNHAARVSRHPSVSQALKEHYRRPRVATVAKGFQ